MTIEGPGLRAVVLAAGFGTRLRPLSLELPKPGWPFFGVPLAAHVLRALGGAGVREAIVNLHHLPERLREALEPWIPEDLRVWWSTEEVIQGTGGALLPWRGLLSGGTFLLANGDTYQELDLPDLLRCHRETGAAATLALRPLPPGSSAPIEADAAGRIVGFLGARAPGSRPGTPCEFTGVHALEPEILARLPERPHCINADVHRHLVAEGVHLQGYFPPEDAFWSDLGTPERYLGAHREVLSRGVLPPGLPGRLVSGEEATPEGGRLVGPSFLGPEARVEAGARAGPFAVLGAGARLGPGARAQDSVLWAGASWEQGRLRGAVLSPSGSTLPAAAQGER
ncbi:MAG: NDP-sugar synthase [Thermodesulfobacteriota bacterium]